MKSVLPFITRQEKRKTMPIKRILIFTVLFTVCSTLFAQRYYSSNKRAISQYEKAMKVLYGGKFSQGILELENVLRYDPKFIEVHLTLGDYYSDVKNMEKAEYHYRAASAIDSGFYPIVWVRLGDIYRDQGLYQPAKACYETYLKYETRKKDDIDNARKSLELVVFRENAVSNPVPFSPQNMGPSINSAAQEYLPTLTADGQTIVFTRKVPSSKAQPAGNEEDLFTSTLVDGQWTPAQRMPVPLNSDGNEGAQCISQDGHVMFFTACERKDGAGSCDIYVCTRRGEKWSRPRNLGKPVNTNRWETQPSFAIDGKTLYFTSNRKGGKGGNDIWKTTFLGNGRWTDPVNLGDSINTPGDEKCPFIHYDNQTLYFASNGHVGMGGFDIFYSRKINDSTWSKPVNLGYPINTDVDESSLIVAPSGGTAIFSSDRAGGFGDLDLYTFQLYEEAMPLAVTYMKGVVYNEKDKSKVAAEVKIIDLDSGEEIATTTSDPVDGSFIISLPVEKNYAVNVSCDNFLFYSDNIELKDATPEEPFLVDIALKPLEKGKSIVLKNIFFETGSAELKAESRVELDKLVDFMNQNTAIRIEISGHTDNVGSDAVNQKLSENRASAVVKYLMDNGVEQVRMRAVGYGETRPIDTNDTETGRANNRRTMFEIID